MARIISLKPGSRVFCGTVEYEVMGSASLTAIKARDVKNGEVRILPIDELSSHSADAEKKLSTPLDCLSKEDQDLAISKFSVIKPAILQNLSRKEIEELAEKHGVHWTTIYRQMRRYKETMSPESLLVKRGYRGGKGKHRTSKELEDLIRLHFEEIIKKKEVDITKLEVKALQREIKGKCSNLGLRPPSWSTVDHRLELFIQEKKLERKRKRKGGRSRTMAGGIFPDANWPLEIVQIDHTPLDIIIVDDENREAIGKPYLSIAIDVYSRMVVGFSVSLDPPSIFSVGELIGHCMLPKNDFLKQVGVNAEYDIYGLISMLHLDNAGEFRSEDFIPFEEEYMVGIRWRPVATPEYGGHIERLAKTLNDYVHQEPGSTMGDVIRRAGYDSEGKACYTIDEIEKWLTILITKIYHVKKHSKLTDRDGHQLSPIEKYKIGILGDDINPGIGNPDVIEDPERLKLFLLPSFERTVQREGIELEKIQYFHDILRNLYGEKGEDGKARKYLIKRNPRRINPINIFDPYQKEFFPIPYRDRTRPPMSVWDLNASKKRCKEKGINDPKEEQIFAAFAELRQIRDESVARTRSARRERDAEKRRNKMIPDAKPEQVTESWMAEESKDFNDEDIASLYDDPSLLTGVMVKSTER